MRKPMCWLSLLLFFCLGFVPLSAEASLISTKQEISMGKDVAQQLEKKYGLVEDEALQARVNAIGQRLVAVSDRKDIAYSFKVLNTDEINALAVPGGFVYLFKGLVDMMPTDDELAGVMAHEVTHVVRRHSVKQMEKSLGTSLLMAVVFGSKGVILQQVAMEALMAGYSRDDEREADQLGFRYSFAAGFNPYNLLITMNKLNDLDQGKKANYGIFSSHPEPEARVARQQGYLKEKSVTPVVTAQSDGSAVVSEGGWSYTIGRSAGGNKPLYRGYMLAGALFRVGQQPNLSPDSFIVLQEEDNAVVYYGDWRVFTFYPSDTEGTDLSVMELATQQTAAFRDWALQRIKPAAA